MRELEVVGRKLGQGWSYGAVEICGEIHMRLTPAWESHVPIVVVNSTAAWRQGSLRYLIE